MAGQRIKHSDTETYLVNFLAGASGSFIVTMIYYLLTSAKYETMFSENASAYHALTEANLNATGIDPTDSYIPKYVAVEPVYWHMKPVKLDEPYILMDHLYPKWEDLFELLPLTKNVIITVDADDADLLMGNLFYKTFVDNHTSKFWSELWKTWKNNFAYFREYDSAILVPREVITEHILASTSNYQNNLKNEPYLNGSYIPEEYSERVFTISIKEIMNDPNKVLSILSTVTGKEVNDNIKQSYTNYLLKQKAFMQEKMPWLVEKYCINI